MRKGRNLEEARTFYAKLMLAASHSSDPRLERVFELVPREAFMPPGPWKIKINVSHRYVETPSDDPVYLYQNALVALDADKGINNGEPYLHAAWIGAVSPQPGETVCHIGAGTGYYTAIMSVLVLPGGRVKAFELEPDLARQARQNLIPFENVSVTLGDATVLPIPQCDLIYVNAGVACPLPSWLQALRPDGRMIFPWRPAEEVGVALLVRRAATGFSVKPLMPSWFIPCVGASSTEGCTKVPSKREAARTRSLWLTADKAPDETATAIYRDVWFSSAELPVKPATARVM